MTCTSCAELEQQVTALRETVSRLNRRCQSAESGLLARLDPGVRTIGRALANCAAEMYRSQNEELLAENARLRALMRGRIAHLVGKVDDVLERIPEQEADHG